MELKVKYIQVEVQRTPTLYKKQNSTIPSNPSITTSHPIVKPT